MIPYEIWPKSCYIYMLKCIFEYDNGILTVLIGLCSIIPLDFDESNLTEPKNSAINRYIYAKY